MLATFTLPGTGRTATDQSGVLTVRRLSGNADGGALRGRSGHRSRRRRKGRTWLPGPARASESRPGQPHVSWVSCWAPIRCWLRRNSRARTDLPLSTDRNYGALLLVNGSETISSAPSPRPTRCGLQQSLSPGCSQWRRRELRLRGTSVRGSGAATAISTTSSSPSPRQCRR